MLLHCAFRFLSLGKQLSIVVFEGYLYAGAVLGSVRACFCVCVWGLLLFGCLLSLSSVCVDHYPLDRCAGVQPACAYRGWGQWAVPVAGV